MTSQYQLYYENSNHIKNQQANAFNDNIRVDAFIMLCLLTFVHLGAFFKDGFIKGGVGAKEKIV